MPTRKLDKSKYNMVPVSAAHSGGAPQPTRLLVDDDAPVVADYDYAESHNNTCRCRGGRLTGRINIMKEVELRDGEQHSRYPGLRSRIVWVIPSGWQMLPITYGLIILAPVFMLWSVKNPDIAYWASIACFLTGIHAVVCLTLTSFRDPGIFPRYSRAMGTGGTWSFCQKTNSYRHNGVVYDNQSETLIDRIDHFCPWCGTTIARNNIDEFQTFVVCVMVHITVTIASAVIGVLDEYTTLLPIVWNKTMEVVAITQDKWQHFGN